MNDLNQTFRECNTLPLEQGFQDETDGPASFSRTLPFYAGAYTDKFFLQITLNEYSFEVDAPEHRRKSTVLFVAREEERKRFIQVLQKSLPVLVCTIAINRDEFGPKSENEDEIEWLTKLTARTRGIAHELLYAWQYLEKYDWDNSNKTIPVYFKPIVAPTPAEESKLLCCDKQIEAFLRVIEQNGVKIKSEADFQNPDFASEVYRYYSLWLKERVVERDVCHQRTLEFLKAHDRAAFPSEVLKALKLMMADHLSLDSFRKARSAKGPTYVAFIQHILSCHGKIDEEAICFIVENVLSKSV